MSDLNLNSIMSLLSGGGTSAISKRTKVSQSDVTNVLSAGVPILLTGMQRNAGTESGKNLGAARWQITRRPTCPIPLPF